MEDKIDPPYNMDVLGKRERKRDPKASALLNNQENLIIDVAVRVVKISEF